jgi:hypothetical protein
VWEQSGVMPECVSLTRCHPAKSHLSLVNFFFLAAPLLRRRRRCRSAGSDRLRRPRPSLHIPSCIPHVSLPTPENYVHAKFVRVSPLVLATAVHNYFVYSTDTIHPFLPVSTLPRLCIPAKKKPTTCHQLLKNSTTNTTSSGLPQPPETHRHAPSRPYRSFRNRKRVCHRPVRPQPSCPTRCRKARLRTSRHTLV